MSRFIFKQFRNESTELPGKERKIVIINILMGNDLDLGMRLSGPTVTE